MKKIIAVILIVVSFTTLLANMSTAFAAGKEAIGEVTAPVSNYGIYDLGPDQQPKSVWTDAVTEQVTVVDNALNGFVVGSTSKSDMLLLGKESKHILVYGTAVLKESVMEKEVGEMLTLAKSGKLSKKEFQLWFAQYIMGRITRLENVNGVLATTLNVETYSKGIHGDPVARIQVGPKDWSYWNIYERTLKDGSVVWVLCRQPATNNGGKKPDPTPTPSPKPEEKPPVVVPTIEEEPARTPDPKPPVVVPTIEEEPARTPDPKPPVVVPTIEEKPAQTPAPKQEPPVVSPTIEEQPAQQTAAQPTTEPPVHQKDNGDAGKGPAF